MAFFSLTLKGKITKIRHFRVPQGPIMLMGVLNTNRTRLFQTLLLL